MKKVLMDLHPCFDQYAGIPQDTRVIFDLLARSGGFQLGGHLFDPSHGTTGFRWSDSTQRDDQINDMSAYIIGLGEQTRRHDHGAAHWQWTRNTLKRISAIPWGRMAIRSLIHHGWLQPDNRLHPIDAEFFQDFIWRACFEKSLTADCRQHILDQTFHGSSMSRALMLRMLSAGCHSASIDASGWDAYLSQTPFPGKIKGGAKLLVRFHDAVPIQNPHTINNPHEHHLVVSKSLKMNAPEADFICNSNATREQLLQLHPDIGDRAHVVHCCVPSVFQPSAKKSVSDIVSRRIETYPSNPDSTPDFSAISKHQKFVEESFHDDYILAVGTIEPRKNYKSIIDGWNRYRIKSGKDTKLVIVGNQGWGEEKLMDLIRTYSHQGTLFPLSHVCLNELIDLYSNARACVVASYTEGFSYSGIEAMRCLTPVVASDIPVHHEVYGDHATFFDPYSPTALASSFDEVMSTSDQDRDSLVTKAREFSMRYNEEAIQSSWEGTLNSIL